MTNMDQVDEVWNRRNLVPPPTIRLPAPKGFQYEEFVTHLSAARDALEQTSSLVSEFLILDRLLYKLNNQLCREKLLKSLKMVRQSLKRLMEMDMKKEVEEFKDDVKRSGADLIYTPSRQMLQYLLVRLLGYLKLLARSSQCCKEAYVHCMQKMGRGDFVSQMLVLAAVTSRIWVLVSAFTAHAVRWYKNLHSFLNQLPAAKVEWLSSSQQLPEDIEDWLDIKESLKKPKIHKRIYNLGLADKNKVDLDQLLPKLVEFEDAADKEEIAEIKQVDESLDEMYNFGASEDIGVSVKVDEKNIGKRKGPDKVEQIHKTKKKKRKVDIESESRSMDSKSAVGSDVIEAKDAKDDSLSEHDRTELYLADKEKMELSLFIDSIVDGESYEEFGQFWRKIWKPIKGSQPVGSDSVLSVKDEDKAQLRLKMKKNFKKIKGKKKKHFVTFKRNILKVLAPYVRRSAGKKRKKIKDTSPVSEKDPAVSDLQLTLDTWIDQHSVRGFTKKIRSLKKCRILLNQRTLLKITKGNKQNLKCEFDGLFDKQKGKKTLKSGKVDNETCDIFKAKAFEVFKGDVTCDFKKSAKRAALQCDIMEKCKRKKSRGVVSALVPDLDELVRIQNEND